MYGEKAVGSIPHFGAIEEKFSHGFPGSARIKKSIHHRQFSLGNARFLASGKCGWVNLIEWAAGISTEDAQEMQNELYRVASPVNRVLCERRS